MFIAPRYQPPVRFVLVVLSLLAVLVSCRKADVPVIAVPEDAVSGPVGRQLDAYLAGITPFEFSATVLVAKGGEVILNKGYGVAIDSPSVPNTAATVMSCGSVTKQFTAAAVMKLQMQGKLKTTD